MNNFRNNLGDTEKFYRAAWQSLSANGSRQVTALLDFFGSAREAWEAQDEEIRQVKPFQGRSGTAILSKRRSNRDYPQELQEICGEKGIMVCSVEESNYPSLLRHVACPPHVLFYKGKMKADRKRIALVGSRKVTPYGKAAAELLGRELAAQGISVVSGGAYGVDTEAHKGALKAGITEAVLACGLDNPYPASNRKLFEEITEKGALISEYPPGTAPMKVFFPIRNRIISGMCRGTVVVEAAEKSGSLITANFALEENRDVFAIPGSIFSQSSLGCNRLIQQGAKLVTKGRDILDEYEDWQNDCQFSLFEMQSNESITQEEERILNLLTPDEPLSIDEIIYRLEQGSAGTVAGILLQLELQGLVQRHPSGGYTARR